MSRRLSFTIAANGKVNNVIRLPPKTWVLIRLVLSALLLWLALRQIDWQALVTASQRLHWPWLVLAWLLVLLSNTLAAARWGWIMRGTGIEPTRWRTIQLYFAGGLINQGIPSTLGGDTYRAVQSTQGQRLGDGPALRYGLMAVALDRAMGLAGNTALGAIGLGVGGLLIAPWAPTLGWSLVALLVLAFAVVALLLHVPSIDRLIARILRAIRLPLALPGIETVFAWPNNAGQLALSLLIHLLTLATFWACLQAYGITVPLQALMIGLPALGLLLMLPISISGWGLRETTLTAVLALWAVPAATTVLASISYGLIVVLAYLPATWVLLRGKSARLRG
jgi:glycosyltransferase 2 family protein